MNHQTPNPFRHLDLLASILIALATGILIGAATVGTWNASSMSKSAKTIDDLWASHEKYRHEADELRDMVLETINCSECKRRRTQ